MPKILNVRLSDAQQKKIRKYIARELILVVMPHWMMKNPQALKQNKSSGDSSETGKRENIEHAIWPISIQIGNELPYSFTLQFTMLLFVTHTVNGVLFPKHRPPLFPPVLADNFKSCVQKIQIPHGINARKMGFIHAIRCRLCGKIIHALNMHGLWISQAHFQLRLYLSSTLAHKYDELWQEFTLIGCVAHQWIEIAIDHGHGHGHEHEHYIAQHSMRH